MDINQNRLLTDSWSTPRDLPPRPSAPLNHTYPYPRPDTQPQLLNNHYLNSKYGNSGQAQALHLPQHSPPLPPYSGPQNATTQSNPAFSSQFQLYLPPQNPTQSLVVNASPYDPAQGIEHFVTLQYQPSAAGANSVKRPVLRAGQACNSCRALKTKCDEGRPHCEACQKNERVCEYTDPPVKKYVCHCVTTKH
jgi:hypothetical protein